MKWIARENPKIDRLACPWLIKRYIDESAEIGYVPFSQVNVPSVEYTHYSNKSTMI